MKKKKNIGKILIILFIVSFVGLYSYIYVMPRVSDTLLETYIAEYDKLDAGIEKTCIVVRDETVVFADSGGEVARNAAQGELVKKGATVASVGGKDYVSQRSGVVSYFYDGLESTMTVDALSSLQESTLTRIVEDMKNGDASDLSVREAGDGQISMGDVVYKIVDNGCWYIVGWFSAEEKEEFSEGRKITVRVDGDVEFDGTVASIVQEEEKFKITVAVSNYYRDFDSCRVKECQLISYNEYGIILMTSSITERDGQRGVYIIDKTGEHVFTPVKVKYTFGDKCLVASNVFYDAEGKSVETVRNYQRIIRDPSKEINASDNISNGN